MDDQTYARAQAIRQGWTLNKSDEDLLDELRRILAAKGKLTSTIMRSVGGTSPASYRYRFGSLMKAYELIGYKRPIAQLVDTRRKIQVARLKLMQEIERLFPGTVSIGTRGGRTRTWLEIGDLKVSVRACLPGAKLKRESWVVRSVPAEDSWVTLLAFANACASSFAHLYILPCLTWNRTESVRLTLLSLPESLHLENLADFCRAVRATLAMARLRGDI